MNTSNKFYTIQTNYKSILCAFIVCFFSVTSIFSQGINGQERRLHKKISGQERRLYKKAKNQLIEEDFRIAQTNYLKLIEINPREKKIWF